MFIVVGLMVCGILIGRWGHIGGRKKIQKGISLTILALLFLLGISVGSNGQLMDNLDTIGWEALVITCGAVAGSVLCAWLVYRFYFVE